MVMLMLIAMIAVAEWHSREHIPDYGFNNLNTVTSCTAALDDPSSNAVNLYKSPSS